MRRPDPIRPESSRPAQAASVPAVTPASARRSPQLQVCDADIVRELAHSG